MNFEKKLDDLLKKDRFIEEDWHYSFIQLSKLFLEKEKLDKNIDYLLKNLDRNIEEDWIWSFVRFLEENLSKSWTEFTQKQKKKIWEWSLTKLENIAEFWVTTVLKILDVLFVINPDSKKQLRVLEPIVKDSEEYQILQNILLQLPEEDEYNEIFIDALLKTLNVDRWNFLGIGYLSKVFVRLGRSPKILDFLDKIKEDKYSKALEEFLGMYEKSTEEFFSVLWKNKREVIKKIWEILEKAGRKWIWYWHHAHQKEEFLKIFLKTTHELWLSLFDEQGWLFDDNNFWYIYEFVAPFISFDDIRKYHKKVGNKTMHIIRLYEVIKNSPKIRNDRTEILEQFLTLRGFQSHYNRCEKMWAKQNAQMEKTTEKYRKQQRGELEKMIAVREEGKVLAGLVDKFYRELKSENKKQKSIFWVKEIQIVKEEIEKFFKWDLFNLEKPVYEEYTKEDGTKEYRGWYWYQIEFFKNVLDLWKNTFHESTISLRSKILKSLLLINTGDIKEVAAYLWKSRKLSDDEAEMFLSVLRKEDVSKVRYHLSGQNIIDVFDLFKGSFEKKKFRKRVQEILWSLLEDDYYYSFRRVEAVSWAHKNKIIDQKWLKKIKSYWTSLLEKDKNYIENFSDEDVIFGINRVLIEMEDEQAILWRINQLKTAKIALTEQETEKAHGGIANEIRWEKHLFKCLENIDFKKYGDAIFELIETGLNLLQKDEKNLVKNLSPYGRYIIFNALNILPLGIEELKKVREIINKYSWDARKYGWIVWRKKYQELLDKVGEIESISISKEISVNRTQNITKIITQKDNEIQKLKNEVRTLKKSLEKAQQYKKNTEQPEDLVIIEWYTGVIHLQNAWNVLRPWKKMPFVLNDGFDADNIAKIIDKPQQLWNYKKVIWIFDLDGKGIITWNKWYNFTPEKSSLVDRECLSKYKILDGCKRWWITLPFLKEHYEIPQVPEDAFLAGTMWQKMDIKIAIEELFFDFSQPDWIKRLISEWYFDTNWKFIWNKNNLWIAIRSLIEDGWVNPKEIYKNFEPLLQKIETIIEESKNN